jgi:hypothetical protein
MSKFEAPTHFPATAVTEDGIVVHLLAAIADKDGNRVIVGQTSVNRKPVLYNADGTVSGDKSLLDSYREDLRLVKVTTSQRRWVNLYSNGFSDINYESRAAADAGAAEGRRSVARLEWYGATKCAKMQLEEL